MKVEWMNLEQRNAELKRSDLLSLSLLKQKHNDSLLESSGWRESTQSNSYNSLQGQFKIIDKNNLILTGPAEKTLYCLFVTAKAPLIHTSVNLSVRVGRVQCLTNVLMSSSIDNTFDLLAAPRWRNDSFSWQVKWQMSLSWLLMLQSVTSAHFLIHEWATGVKANSQSPVPGLIPEPE